jgi:hypothetical protein
MVMVMARVPVTIGHHHQRSYETVTGLAQWGPGGGHLRQTRPPPRPGMQAHWHWWQAQYPLAAASAGTVPQVMVTRTMNQ